MRSPRFWLAMVGISSFAVGATANEIASRFVDEWIRTLIPMVAAIAVIVVGIHGHRQTRRFSQPPFAAGLVRPRYGQLRRADGSIFPLVVLPTNDPHKFVARHAGDESPVVVQPGDEVGFDMLGPRQTVTFEIDR